MGFAFQILSKPDDGSGVRFLFNQKKSPRKAPEANKATWLMPDGSAWPLADECRSIIGAKSKDQSEK